MSLRTRFFLPIIAFALVLLAGCGGSGSNTPVAPPGGGFSNSNLSGTYVFSFSGTDTVNQIFFTAAGTFTADGNGGISAGTIDINDAGYTQATIGNNSGYAITADGRGRGTLVTNNVGTIGIDFVLNSNSHGMIMRFDQNGTGSGTLDLQDSTVAQSNLTNYAFAMSGVDSSGNPLVTEGMFSLGGTSTIGAGGIEDFNDSGVSNALTGLALTGTVSVGANGPGTATLTAATSPFGTLTFDVWTIDATHLKLIEIDGVELLSGDAYTQQTTLSSGPLVYTMTGLDTSGALFAAGGYVNYSGPSTLTAGLEDINDSGTVNQSPSVTGSLTATANTGRYAITLSGLFNGVGTTNGSYSFTGYPFTAGGATGVLLMETDGQGVTSGTAMVQTAQTFTSGQGVAFNLTGANAGGEVDDIAEFTANSDGTLSNGIIDENDENTGAGEVVAFKQGLGTGGTYTYDSPATGRGVLIYPSTNTTYNGSLGLAYYVVNSSTALFIEGDSGQVGVGTFALQSTTASQAAVSRTQAHLSTLRAIAAAKVKKRKS
ncbi:MAG TPA: hypothetical protein VKV39_08575 [Candidatus Sulfotelmatobacter sp.]|nr:hypothetical protein [Candidatus Sulfotelmatobacter sp.]